MMNTTNTSTPPLPNSLQIGGFQPFSTIDFPNHLACVVFLQGCNFRCGYCHNAHLWPTHPTVDTLSPSYPPSYPSATEALLAWLATRQGKLTGVVFSGGEACLQAEALLPVLKAVKQLGFAIKLDTNGSLPHALKTLVRSGCVDTVAMDVKAPLHRYNEVAGCAVNTCEVHESLQFLNTYSKESDNNFAFETRTTVIPNLLNEVELLAMVPLLQASPRHYLQAFVPEYTASRTLRSLPPTSNKRLLAFQHLLRDQGIPAHCRF